jgi:PAS domain S-box-containing protein
MRPGIKFLHSLFEVAHVEFQTYDVYNHKLVFSSGLAHRLLGYSEDEYFKLSKDFYKSIVHPDDFQKIRETIERVSQAKKGEVIEMSARLRRRDGNYIWVSSRQMILDKSPDNHICTIIRECEDITQLVELQDQLEEKVEQLKVVSYKNSHLLRNPVASIIGLVDMIEEQGINGEHNRQILHFLKEAITKLDTVIHEINDVARLD